MYLSLWSYTRTISTMKLCDVSIFARHLLGHKQQNLMNLRKRDRLPSFLGFHVCLDNIRKSIERVFNETKTFSTAYQLMMQLICKSHHFRGCKPHLATVVINDIRYGWLMQASIFTFSQTQNCSCTLHKSKQKNKRMPTQKNKRMPRGDRYKEDIGTTLLKNNVIIRDACTM